MVSLVLSLSLSLRLTLHHSLHAPAEVREVEPALTQRINFFHQPRHILQNWDYDNKVESKISKMSEALTKDGTFDGNHLMLGNTFWWHSYTAILKLQERKRKMALWIIEAQKCQTINW